MCNNVISAILLNVVHWHICAYAQRQLNLCSLLRGVCMTMFCGVLEKMLEKKWIIMSSWNELFTLAIFRLKSKSFVMNKSSIFGMNVVSITSICDTCVTRYPLHAVPNTNKFNFQRLQDKEIRWHSINVDAWNSIAWCSNKFIFILKIDTTYFWKSLSPSCSH